MSASGGNKAIVAALMANIGISLTKFVAFFISGATSMLAEAVHSLADSINEVLLILGGKRAQKEATDEHPFGYGRTRYVYAFVVSILLFSVGGVFALYEGVHKIRHPEPITQPWLPITVLVVSLILETFSLRTAMKEANQVRGKDTWLQYIRHAKAPELPVVLLEDVAAEFGLLFALLGVTASILTGNGIYDGIGTVAIGGLLVAVALLLGFETKSLLVGEGATPKDTAAIRMAIEAGKDIERVIHMKTLYLGPDELMVAAKVAVRHDDSAAAIAKAIDEAEKRIRAAVPVARVIYLEPDLYDAERAAASA